LETFRLLAKTDPIFAQQEKDAIDEAVANAEVMLATRMDQPDERPVIDKNGVIVGVDRNWRSANQLLLRFLSRHDVEWIEAQRRDGTMVITRADDPAARGLSYTVTSDDMHALPPDRRQLLLDVFQEIEANRELAKSPAALASAPATVPLLSGPTEPTNV
jgi:hypothetical protein